MKILPPAGRAKLLLPSPFGSAARGFQHRTHTPGASTPERTSLWDFWVVSFVLSRPPFFTPGRFCQLETAPSFRLPGLCCRRWLEVGWLRLVWVWCLGFRVGQRRWIRIGDRRNPQRTPSVRPLHPPRAASARPAPRRSRSSAFRHHLTIHPSGVRRRGEFVYFSEASAASRPPLERVGYWRGCHRLGWRRRGRCLGKSTIRTAPTGGAESRCSRPLS